LPGNLQTEAKDASFSKIFNQKEFDGIFIQGLLAVNLDFNVANNVAFRKIFRYLNHKILIPSPNLICQNLLVGYKVVVSVITVDIPMEVKVSIVADVWTFPNKFAFITGLDYYITDDWELKEVFQGFEKIKGAHWYKPCDDHRRSLQYIPN
jgi:hypothetical protein